MLEENMKERKVKDMQVKGVTAAEVTSVSYDRAKRAATFVFVCTVGDATYREEVTLYEHLWHNA